MDAAYSRFLRTSLLAVWVDSLAAFEEQLADTSADLQILSRATCLAVYVAWLSGQSGDEGPRARALESLQRFSDQIGSLAVNDTSPASAYATAIVLGSGGYKRSALELLAGHGPLEPEVALLVVPNDPARRTAQLRDMALDRRNSFPPAFYVYCDALLGFGRIGEVSRLVREYGKDVSDPFVADLMGKLHERGGRWNDAHQVYKESSWPIHRVRSAICGMIANASDPGVQETYAELEQRTIRGALRQLDVDADQMEVARTSAFVNACRWSSIEGWLIEFEAGKLSFARRRYWEADDHLSRAEASCPPNALFAVRDLRFCALTWLTSRRDPDQLPMLPEALQWGYAALEAADDADADAHIRAWVARETRDYGTLLGPVFESADLLSIAEAREMAGNELERLTSLLSCIAFTYVPRAMNQLITWFSQARLFTAADYLTGLVLKESDDDFTALYELGQVLLPLRHTVDSQSTPYERLNARLRSLSARLQELSQSDFQHLIRAFQFFSNQRRDDLAELMLTRASTLASGTEENLAVAVARRINDRFAAGERLQQGLACVLRAEREARHSMDRLQVAREYFHYGQIRRGRQILQNEGVFEERPNHKDIEYIIALQCGPWMEPHEFQPLAQGAVKAAIRNLRAGLRRGLDSWILTRLLNTIGKVDKGFAEHLMHEEGIRVVTNLVQVKQRKTRPRDAWPGLLHDIHAKDAPVPGSTVVERLQSLMHSRPVAGVALWGALLSEMDASDAEVRWAEPERVGRDIPICKDRDLKSGRALELHRLFRERAHAATDAERELAHQKIRAFYDDEQALLAAWNRERQERTRPHLEHALRCCRTSRGLLETVIVRRPYAADTSPILRELFQRVLDDARQCIEYLSRREAWITDQLHQYPELPPHATRAQAANARRT